MHMRIAGCPSDNESCLYTAVAATLDRLSRVQEHGTIGSFPSDTAASFGVGECDTIGGCLLPPLAYSDTGWECAVGLVTSRCCDVMPPLHATRQCTLAIDDVTQVAAVASLASSIATTRLLGEGSKRACTARRRGVALAASDVKERRREGRIRVGADT
uniref:Uncharacterized protein n=1 Tax=Oryza nivara TaxID=4536 RepID=A0A0E0I2B1_ORYNI